MIINPRSFSWLFPWRVNQRRSLQVIGEGGNSFVRCFLLSFRSGPCILVLYILAVIGIIHVVDAMIEPAGSAWPPSCRAGRKFGPSPCCRVSVLGSCWPSPLRGPSKLSWAETGQIAPQLIDLRRFRPVIVLYDIYSGGYGRRNSRPFPRAGCCKVARFLAPPASLLLCHHAGPPMASAQGVDSHWVGL